MSKSVLISIRPQWCELIANGKKTIEVRKTRPKLETPFKCYIYCTVGGDALCPPHMNCSKWDIHRQNNGTANGRIMSAIERAKSDYCFANGKIIGEFVCDQMCTFVYGNGGFLVAGDVSTTYSCLTKSCLTHKEFREYAKNKSSYGWHISALQIYDNPKELSEFKQCDKCPYGPIERCNEHEFSCDGTYSLSRPPQSWCYVEGLDAK